MKFRALPLAQPQAALDAARCPTSLASQQSSNKPVPPTLPAAMSFLGTGHLLQGVGRTGLPFCPFCNMVIGYVYVGAEMHGAARRGLERMEHWYY